MGLPIAHGTQKRRIMTALWRSSPSAASRPVWLRTPSLAAHVAAADRRARSQWSCRNQAGLILRLAGFFSFFFVAASRWSRNRFPTQRGGFSTPGTGGAFTVFTEAEPVPSVGIATEVRHLTSSPSSRGQSLGGALWRPAYTPG